MPTTLFALSTMSLTLIWYGSWAVVVQSYLLHTYIRIYRGLRRGIGEKLANTEGGQADRRWVENDFEKRGGVTASGSCGHLFQGAIPMTRIGMQPPRNRESAFDCVCYARHKRDRLLYWRATSLDIWYTGHGGWTFALHPNSGFISLLPGPHPKMGGISRLRFFESSSTISAKCR